MWTPIWVHSSLGQCFPGRGSQGALEGGFWAWRGGKGLGYTSLTGVWALGALQGLWVLQALAVEPSFLVSDGTGLLQDVLRKCRSTAPGWTAEQPLHNRAAVSSPGPRPSLPEAQH